MKKRPIFILVLIIIVLLIYLINPNDIKVFTKKSSTSDITDTVSINSNKYFALNQMPIASGRYWNNGFGREQGQIEEDLEGLQNMRILARNMAWHLKCREAAEKAGVKMPAQEDVVFTNFVR